ncbi:MAG: type II secretion system protein GspG [Deltaproteobacteria bacterium]|nr:type II secretion system protein GspG [Deltaproteobacteria bacterium]
MSRGPYERTVFFAWERRSAWRRALNRARLRSLLLGGAAGLVLLGLGAVASHRRRTFATRAASWSIQDAVAAFRADHGRCPTGLEELAHPPETLGGVRRYLTEARADGWGRAFRVTCPGRRHPHTADVTSGGSSGTFQDLSQLE